MNAWLLGGFMWLAANAESPVDFATEVLPTLTRAGCNNGSCHGAAAGRGGFRLSLLGADPPADYDAIVHAFEGRRIQFLRPEDSLFLTKPLGQVDHGGGAVLDLESPDTRRLLRWIEQGATLAAPQRLTQLRVVERTAPSSSAEQLHDDSRSATFLVEFSRPTVELRVQATFSTGECRDVTHLTLFTPVDPTAAQVTLNGNVAQSTVLRRGRQIVIARYLDRVIPIVLDVPLFDEPVARSPQAVSNWVDVEIHNQLARMRIPPSPRADDSPFLRRLFLDLTGQLPTPDEAAEYRADSSPDKAERVVERLLASEAFVDFWTLQLARWLRLHSLPNEPEAVAAYSSWLRAQLRDGRPFDVIARDLLLATGDSHQIGPANFPRMVADARGHAELVGRFFLGVRMGCANCHDHPLDRWKQDDYHGLAAVFARVDRGRNVRLLARGAVTNPRTGEVASPRIPGERNLAGEDDPRSQFTNWLLASDDRQFSRAIVNRLWQNFFGRGLVDPVDDLRETNPATHPELLDRLATDFVDHGYDLRHTLRLIATSATYARSSSSEERNRQDAMFYARALDRPLGAEVLADLLDDVTGVRTTYPSRPRGTRAVHLVDPLAAAPTLDLLGRCSRIAECADEFGEGTGLATYLHLLNGDLLNTKIASPEGRLHQLLAAGMSNSEVIVDFYHRGLNRPPTSTELSAWLDTIQDGDRRAEERVARLEDFVWSLLSCREFTHH